MNSGLSSPMTALVVDDEPLLAEVVREELEYLGVQAVSCGSVAEAKAKIAETSFSLVVSDVRMPYETGVELLRWVKLRNPAHPRMILMTAFSDLTLEEALHAGADALFMKPFDFDAIGQLVTDFASQKKSTEVQTHRTIDVAIEGPLQETLRFLPGRGGCFIATESASFRAGDLVSINIVSENLHLRAACQVRWCRRSPQGDLQPAGLGLEYLNPVEISDFSGHKVAYPWTNVVSFIPSKLEKK